MSPSLDFSGTSITTGPNYGEPISWRYQTEEELLGLRLL
jgi:hypothetical protein